MCLPACTVKLADITSRRSFLGRVGATACAAAVAPLAARADESQRQLFQRVVDLTHTLGPAFPMPMADAFALEQVSKRGKQLWNAHRWHIHEHVGTHLDAPLHCSDGISGDRIPAAELVGPLVIVDIRPRAADNSDAQLTPDDLKQWEHRYGPIPPGAVVALNSGWDQRVTDARQFFGRDDKGGYHFPGFHLEAVQFLHEQRNVKGIGVDTISLDHGLSGDFPSHHYWLGHGHWGLENLANLADLPPRGATIVVGSPKIAGCTGGPSRVLALL